MSDRPTPETDALDCELHNPRVLQDRYSEMLERARKLERERDEEREQNAKLRNIAEIAINYLDQSYRNGFSDEVIELRYELKQLEGEK